MTVKIYNLPSWFASSDDKPSSQIFDYFVNNANPIEGNVTKLPTLTTLNVESSYSIENSYLYNFIQFENKWYVIKDITYSANNIILIKAELDIYLSTLLFFFNEDIDCIPNKNNLVFFKQKHLNRWFYNFNNENVITGTVINFEQQFYLKNKHLALADIGKNLVKHVDSLNYSNYQGSNNVLYSESTLYSLDGNGFIYALWKMTPKEWDQAEYNNITSVGLVSISCGGATSNQTIPWWMMLQFVGSEAYIDEIVLPVPVDYAYVIADGIQNIQSVSNIKTEINKFAPGTIQENPYWTNAIVWACMPQNLYYFISPKIVNTTNNWKKFNNIYNIEPYLFQYCNFRLRGAGEDAFTDITFFNNVTADSFINTLYSFCINLNHPTTQITNILYSVMVAYSINNNIAIMIPYGYNNINDAFYVLDWKLIYPSLSNNWSNYLLNNLNQYHASLNIAHYDLQKSQADIAFDSMNAADGIFSGFMSSGIMGAISGAINGAENITNGTFNELSQQQEYNYLNTGKCKDMSRISNERLATNNNAISYNNFTLSFIFETPPQYEQNLAINYCMLNGYVLDRWEPFYYWKNRQICNFVKCCYFSDSMLSTLLPTYKTMIDKLLNKGFRVWITSSATPASIYTTVPFNEVINMQQNNEINQNNDEINYLNKQ